MKFTLQRIWPEQKKTTLITVIYGLVNPRKRRKRKNAKPIENPHLASSSASISRSAQLPVPEASTKLSKSSSS